MPGQLHNVPLTMYPSQQQRPNDLRLSDNQQPVGSLQFDSNSFPVLSSAVDSNRYNIHGGVTNTNTDFSIHKEDFPALSGVSSQQGKNDINVNMLNNSDVNMLNRASINIGGQLDLSSSNTVGSHIRGFVQGTQIGTGQENINKETRYGLMGIVDVIKGADRDLNFLFVGTDLKTFGVNVDAQDLLYSTFHNPFAEPSSSDHQYTTPQSYLTPTPSLKNEHLVKFAIETVFYMFYSMPRDLMQAVAAQELYRRHWKYHAEMRIWLKPRTTEELMSGHPNIHFWFFDVSDWSPRLFTTQYTQYASYRGNIAAGFLEEKDIRVTG